MVSKTELGQKPKGRLAYRPALGNVEKLCRALDVPPGGLLELIDDLPKPKANPKRKRTLKR